MNLLPPVHINFNLISSIHIKIIDSEISHSQTTSDFEIQLDWILAKTKHPLNSIIRYHPSLLECNSKVKSFVYSFNVLYSPK